jgi:hypothetical protein
MVRGSCLCTAVRYRVTGPLRRMSHCHCSMCRKAHGAAFGTYVNASATQFAWEAGEASVTAYVSSPGVRRTFCARCGSTLQWLWDRQPDVVGIAAGTLDDDPRVRPDMHIYVGSKAPWYDIADRLPQFAEADETPPAG